MELLDGSLSVVTRALLSWSLAELQPFRLECMSLPPTLAYCALPGLPRVVSSALHVVPTYVRSWSMHVVAQLLSHDISSPHHSIRIRIHFSIKELS